MSCARGWSPPLRTTAVSLSGKPRTCSKGELLRGHYRLLRNKVSRTDDVEDLKRYFGDIAMYHRERLTGGTPAGSGTHPMADTCRALSLECSRQVLKDCMEFSRILSLGQPEEDVKRKTDNP